MVNKNRRSFLTLEQRKLIEDLVKQGKNTVDIGRAVGKNHTTIRRELNRFSCDYEYDHTEAHRKATLNLGYRIPRKVSLEEVALMKKDIQDIKKMLENLTEIIKRGPLSTLPILENAKT